MACCAWLRYSDAVRCRTAVCNMLHWPVPWTIYETLPCNTAALTPTQHMRATINPINSETTQHVGGVCQELTSVGIGKEKKEHGAGTNSAVKKCDCKQTSLSGPQQNFTWSCSTCLVSEICGSFTRGGGYVPLANLQTSFRRPTSSCGEFCVRPAPSPLTRKNARSAGSIDARWSYSLSFPRTLCTLVTGYCCCACCGRQRCGIFGFRKSGAPQVTQHTQTMA